VDRDEMKNYEFDYTNQNSSKTASFLIFLAWAIVIVGVIIPFIPRIDDTHFSTVGIFILIGALFRGIAEIIKLLHNINSKLK
jgi:FtsH-binding integral membrane protein